MNKDDDVMVIYMYRRDVDAILTKSPPDTSPIWNELDDSQRNLIDAFKHAEVETYD